MSEHPDTVLERADLVREMLERGCDCDIPAVCENTTAALAALDALVAALEQAERNAADYQHAYTDANEAREQAERDRDEARLPSLAETQNIYALAREREARVAAERRAADALERAARDQATAYHDGYSKGFASARNGYQTRALAAERELERLRGKTP